MTPITPFWFKLRQCKIEAQSDGNTLKVTAPNQRDAYLQVRSEGAQWHVSVRLEPTGDALATSSASNAKAAWEAAFELYRTLMLV